MLRSSLHLVALAAALAVLAPSTASAAPPAVLTEASGRRLGEAFARLPAPLRLRSAQVSGDRVAATICRGPDEAACFAVTLDDPAYGCAGTLMGPFCARSGGADPLPADVRDGLHAVLDRGLEGIWMPRTPGVGGAPPPSQPAAWKKAALLTVSPLVIGALAGAAWRWARQRAVRSTRNLAAFVALTTALAAIVGPLAWRVGLWDSAALGALAAIAAAATLAGDLRRRRAHTALAMGATLVSLIVAELALRAVVPKPYLIPPAKGSPTILPLDDLDRLDRGIEGDTLFLSPRGLLDHCGYLHPDHFTPYFERFTAIPPGTHRVVLHLGDSMTVGGGVGRDKAFPQLLTERTPGVVHLNAAAQGTTVDFHYVVAKRWIERMPRAPDLVVVNLFPGNDVDDMDQPMPCCDDGPLLTYGAAGAAPRCDAPRWPAGYGRSLGWFYRHSPPPFPLLWAAPHSNVAAHAVDGVLALRRLGLPYKAERAILWQHLEAALAALRDELARRRVRLVAVIVPLRPALEAPDPATTEGDATRLRMMETCARLGIPALDPWDRFREIVRRDGAPKYFLPPGDVHFTIEGHRAMADWLADHLRDVAPAETSP